MKTQFGGAVSAPLLEYTGSEKYSVFDPDVPNRYVDTPCNELPRLHSIIPSVVKL